MKNLFKGICIASVFVIVVAFANQANATTISFSGSYSLTDAGGVAGFNETITFIPGTGIIGNFEPATDAIFLDAGDITDVPDQRCCIY